MTTGPCLHKVCNRHQPRSEGWWCYLDPGPKLTDFSTHRCRCGTWVQGGALGLAAHQRVVGCTESGMLPMDVRRK